MPPLVPRSTPAIPETTWREIDRLLGPAARGEIEQIVSAWDHVEYERGVDPTASHRWRKELRRDAIDSERAVSAVMNALGVLEPGNPAWDLVTRLYTADQDTPGYNEMMTLLGALESLRSQTQLLVRLQGQLDRMARQRERRGPERPYFMEAVVRRLSCILATHGHPTRRQIVRDRESDHPGGTLYELAAILRPWLPCLPAGDEALHKALIRARSRERGRRNPRSTARGTRSTPRAQ